MKFSSFPNISGWCAAGDSTLTSKSTACYSDSVAPFFFDRSCQFPDQDQQNDKQT